MTIRQIFSAVFCLALTAAPAAGDGSDAERDLEELLPLLEGQFDNCRQVNRQPQTGEADTPRYSPLHQYRVKIVSGHLPGNWVYSQINDIEEGFKVYRQVVSEFFIDDQGALRSRAWSFADPEIKQAGTPDAAFLSQLTPRQLVQTLPEGCVAYWDHRGDSFHSEVRHQECVIQSRYKDEKRQIFAVEIVSAEGIRSREGAYRMDGTLAFGLEGEDYYRFERSSRFDGLPPEQIPGACSRVDKVQ